MEFKAENEDLYELLEIQFDASINEIKRAYRKKALKCHPDKNPNNKNASEEFHKLSKILEILTDESARKAYDRVLKGKKEAAIRHSALDSKRRKLKEDLDAREKAASSYIYKSNKSPDQLLKEEIDRLRKEGSKQVQEEMDYLKQQLIDEMMSMQNKYNSNEYRIRIKWKAEKSDSSNGGYTSELLHKFLSKYGNISVLVMSKKNGSALLEFDTQRAAEMAIDIEKGLADNPLILTWVDNRSHASKKVTSSTIKETDFESVTLMKLRQSEERKQLIQQMMAEDIGN